VRGAQFLGVANTLVGVLGVMGVNQFAGLALNQGNVATAISLVVGVWGLLAGFLKKS
jgi:hypothetical protein